MPLSRGDGGAEKKCVTASMAPDKVLADEGKIIGGENGAVKGILNRFVMRNACSSGPELPNRLRNSAVEELVQTAVQDCE